MNRRAPLAATNITPLVDVLLILVALLLLMAPQFIKRLPVSLPRIEMQGEPHLREALLITVSEKGQLAIDGELMSVEDVIARISQGRTTVEVAASGALPYEKIVKLVESLRAAKPQEIQLLVR